LLAHAQLARHAARLLSASHGGLSIERLAASHGVSYKRLERVFARDVGLSPKHFARVARVQRALELRTLRPGVALAALAVHSGYADQAHFSREFSSQRGSGRPGALRPLGVTSTHRSVARPRSL